MGSALANEGQLTIRGMRRPARRTPGSLLDSSGTARPSPGPTQERRASSSSWWRRLPCLTPIDFLGPGSPAFFRVGLGQGTVGTSPVAHQRSAHLSILENQISVEEEG